MVGGAEAPRAAGNESRGSRSRDQRPPPTAVSCQVTKGAWNRPVVRPPPPPWLRPILNLFFQDDSTPFPVGKDECRFSIEQVDNSQSHTDQNAAKSQHDTRGRPAARNGSFETRPREEAASCATGSECWSPPRLVEATILSWSC